MKTRTTQWSEVEVQCSVCGRFSQKIRVPLDVENQGAWHRQDAKVWNEALASTGYLNVRLYDDSAPMCCRECAEVLLGRKTVEPQQEMPF